MKTPSPHADSPWPRRALDRARGRTGRSRPGVERAGDVTVTRVESNGEHVRVSSLTGPSGTDFVLVAGIGVASDYYIRLALDLNEVGTVHAIDLPGFAGVRHSGKPLGIEAFAGLTEAVLDELGLVEPVLVGHSMGAQVVTEVAARRGDIASLVLIGPVVNAKERTIVQQAMRLALCAGREPFAITAHVAASYLLCGPRWFFTVLPRMMRYPIEERLPHVRAHTLIMRGEFDGNSPSDWAGYLAGRTPDARAWEIPGAAHSVMWAHAREVAQLCLEHLKRTEDDDAPVLLLPSRHPRPHDRAPADSAPGSLHARRAARVLPPRIREHLPLAETTIRDMGARISGSWMTLRGMLHDDDRLLAEGSRRQLDARRRENSRDDADAPGAAQATPIAARSTL